MEFWIVPCKTGPPGTINSKGKPFSACVAACRQTISCKGFDWVPETKECWLSDHPGKDKPIQVTFEEMKKVSTEVK